MNMLFGSKKAPPPKVSWLFTAIFRRSLFSHASCVVLLRRYSLPQPTAHDGLAKMAAHVQTMGKRERLVESKMAAQQQQAKACAKAKNKRGAMMALKKKKVYETELTQLSNTRFQLEQQMIMVEQAVMGSSTLNAMKTGASAMQQMTREMCVPPLPPR